MWTSKKTKNTLIKIKAKALKIISTHNVLETKLVDIEMKSMPPFILITDCPALRSRGLPRPQRETNTYRQFYHSNILFSQKRHCWDLSPIVINPGINRFSFRAQTKIVGSEGQRFSDDSWAKRALTMDRGRRNIWYKYKQTRKHFVCG